MRTRKRRFDTVKILGVPFANITMGKALELVGEYLTEERNHHICTGNPEFVMVARKNAEFKRILQTADMVVADGVGIVWAARHIGKPIPGTVTGIDLCEAAFQKFEGLSIYLLGGADGVAEKAAHNLSAKYPGLNVVGYHNGFFDAAEETLIIDEIKLKRPDMLLVGIGMPRQEKWIKKNFDLPVRVSIGVGGSLDIYSGNTKRTPMAFRRLRLEWFYRLITQPTRAWRMLNLPKFVIAMLIGGGKTRG